MKRHPLRLSVAVLALAALIGAAGCGSDDKDVAETGTTAPTTEAATTESSTAAADVTVTNPWARTSPAAATMGAAYMTLTATQDDKLVGVKVPAEVAKTAEIHETVPAGESKDMGEDTTTMGGETTTTMGGETTMGGDTTMGGGEMTMQPVESIDLPAGKAVALEPGGYHIMLIDLVAPLKAGDTIDITLTFEKAGEKTVSATVKDA